MTYENFKYIFKRLNSYNSSKILKFSKNFTFIGIFLGSVALIISLSVLEGFEKKLFEKAVNFSSHINIISFKRDFLPGMDSVLAKINKNDNVSEVYPIISNSVIMRTKRDIKGLVLKGISYDYQKKISKFFNDSLNKIANNEIVLSTVFAKRNDIEIGEKVIVYRAKVSNSLQTSVTSFVVKGFFHSGFGKYDENFAFISENKARKFFKVPGNSVSSYEVYLKNAMVAKEVALELEKKLEYPFYCQSFFQIHQQMFAWIEIQKVPIPIILGIIIIIALLNIITSLLINVIEKNKTIGILRGLGMRTSVIKYIFIGKGIFVSLKATLYGMLFSFIILYLQKQFGIIKLDSTAYFIDQVPVEFRIEHFIMVFFLTLFFALLSSYIPAKIATKVNPLKVLKFD